MRELNSETPSICAYLKPIMRILINVLKSLVEDQYTLNTVFKCLDVE